MFFKSSPYLPMYCHPWRLVSPQNCLNIPITAFLFSWNSFWQHWVKAQLHTMRKYSKGWIQLRTLLVLNGNFCVVLLRVQLLPKWLTFHEDQNGQQAWKEGHIRFESIFKKNHICDQTSKTRTWVLGTLPHIITIVLSFFLRKINWQII